MPIKFIRVLMQNKKDVYRIICNNIHNARKAKGLTQEDFAELMNKSWSYIAKLETVVQNFSIGKLMIQPNV